MVSKHISKNVTKSILQLYNGLKTGQEGEQRCMATHGVVKIDAVDGLLHV